MLKLISKRIGWGTLSLVLFILAILFSFSFPDKPAVGDIILNNLGLKAWSNGVSGVHYTVIITIVFLCLSYYVGNKFSDNIFAKIGKKLSIIFTILATILLIVMLIL